MVIVVASVVVEAVAVVGSVVVLVVAFITGSSVGFSLVVLVSVVD